MAKSVYEKRKRIAHNKNEDHEMFPGDNDIVSSIIKGMENNLPVSTNKLEGNSVQSSRTFSQTEINPPTNQNHVQKCRKVGLSRKFPLMEKSQKVLKQLKHNRKIPKPRAHLAALPNSSNDNSISTEKSKKTKIIEKKTEKPQNKITCKHKCDKTMSPESKRKKIIQKSEHQNTSAKHVPSSTMKRNSSIEESVDSENDCSNISSDFEFEKFIEKHKEDLPKKSTSRKTKKQKPPKKIHKKHISRSVPSESDSDFCDEASPKTYYKYNKRIKNNHKIPGKMQSSVCTEDSVSEMDAVNDDIYHDSSSESHSADDMLSKSNVCGFQLSEQVDSEPNPVPVELNSSLHKPSDITPLVNNDQPNVLHEMPLLVDNAQSSILQKTSGIASLVDTAQSNVSHKDESLGVYSAIKSEPITIPCQDKSVIVDLTESDNECESAFTTPPKIVMVSSLNQNDPISNSEESDIELLDVVVHDLPKSRTNVDELNIKTEKINTTPSCSNAKPQNADLKISLNKKYEVAYATDICKQHDEDKLQSCLPTNSEDLFVLHKKVKEENSDCEIVFEDASTSNPTKNLSNVQTCNSTGIKTEKNVPMADGVNSADTIADTKCKFTKKEQKLHEVACSNFRNLTNRCNKNLGTREKEEMIEPPSDLATTLQVLKEEFATYQEIIETEQVVESTFKLMEKRQADKIMSLKSKMKKLMGSSSSNVDVISNAMNTLCGGSELSNLQSLKDCIKVPSPCSNVNADKSSIRMHNSKTFTPTDLVPLSSISEKDIKHNLSELQCEVKQEKSPDEINNMSFGEKCAVCAKDALAACQQCAKVFFCSNECGKNFWEAGHKDACVK